jgi:hypothetical protein
MHPRFIPLRKLNAIAHPNLVVDIAEIVPNNLLGNSQLFRNFPILKSPSHELNHKQLSGGRACD